MAKIEILAPGVAPVATKKKGVQQYRFYAQIFSVFINVWIGIQFYLWVSHMQSGGKLWDISRPPGVEGWLPIGSLVSLLHWIYSGTISTIHPAGMIIFIVALSVAFLFKKGFCSWVCPVGFISELLGDISDKLFRRRVKPPAWLDWPLRMLKYLILAFFVWAIVIQMTPQAIEGFLITDYNKVTDVLMLRFFTDITVFALTVIVVLFGLSLIVRGFWCRYLCPYGALLGLLSLISPTRIRRNESSCTDCSSCTNACPAFIKVESVKEVVSDECIGCMACIDSCPVSDTLEIVYVSKKRRISPRTWAALVFVAFWGVLFIFKMVGPWENSVTNDEYMRLIPTVTKGEYTHP